MTGNDDFDFARREILLRRIGRNHSFSRATAYHEILPVKRSPKMNTRSVLRMPLLLAPTPGDHYAAFVSQRPARKWLCVVNVLNCANAGEAYGYAISKNKKDDIVACIGRRQPVACYLINIKFKSTGIVTARMDIFWAAMTPVFSICWTLFLFFRGVKQRRRKSINRTEEPYQTKVGLQIYSLWDQCLFDTETRKLMINGKTVDLTKTETRVLKHFRVVS